MRIKSIVILMALVGAVFSTQTAKSEEYKLRWEVVQPFRLLKYESDHKIHEWAFADLSPEEKKERPVSAMEAKLNNPNWWDELTASGITRKTEIVRIRREVDLGAPSTRDPAKINTQLGWASLLRTSTEFVEGKVSGSTCWNADLQSYRYCTSEIGDIRRYNQYIRPATHLVRVWLEASPDGKSWASPDGKCYFLSENEAIIPAADYRGAEEKIAHTPCNESVMLRVPHEAESSLKVTAGILTEDQNYTEADTTEIAVEDILVVSIGDSFASGEGNPEVPARLSNSFSITPKGQIGFEQNAQYGKGIPSRNLPHGAARWSDTRCHRSLYAAPARAAIALALHGDRHHAITFVSAACSGAEITRGLLWPQDGVECVEPRPEMLRRLHYPQIGMVVETLDASASSRAPHFPLKREDGKAARIHQRDRYYTEVIEPYQDGKLRKSNNGFCASWPSRNAVGQAPTLATASFGPDRQIDVLFLKVGGNDFGFAPLVANRVLNGVEGDFLNWLIRAGVGAISPEEATKRIEESNLFLDRRFELLNIALQRKLEIEEPKRIIYSLYPNPTTDENGRVCGDSNKGMNVSAAFKATEVKKASDIVDKLNVRLRGLSDKYGWTVVDGYLDDFKKHGICAVDDDTREAADFMGIPTRSEPFAGDWSPLKPFDEYYPYAATQRWFRTLNDAYMTTHMFKGVGEATAPRNNSADELYLALRTQGGPLHPNAQGHAKMADYLFCAAAKQLEKDKKLKGVDCAPK